MTAFTPADLPPTINSVEKLAVWAAEVLQNLYPNLTTVEFLNESGTPQNSRVVESCKFFLTAPNPPEWRHLSRFSFRLSPNHQVEGKIWEHIQDLGTSAIPTGMTE